MAPETVLSHRTNSLFGIEEYFALLGDVHFKVGGHKFRRLKHSTATIVACLRDEDL